MKSWITELYGKGIISQDESILLENFLLTYNKAAVSNGTAEETAEGILKQYLLLIIEQVTHPHPFSPYHRGIKEPFNYYQFGLDFIKALIVFEKSSFSGNEQLKDIEEQLKENENVILFGNHQIEPDPQVIDLLLKHNGSSLGEKIIYIAGNRVTSDLIAAPLSKGRNMLCIYSKKYIEHPPEQRDAKILHNQTTMRIMKNLLDEGGYCIYVAPSGGRDRPSSSGEVEVALFDPQSIELFCLLGKNSKKPTHFYPLALDTFALLPPPKQVEHALGEQRCFSATAVHLSLGEEIDVDKCAESLELDKKKRREQRSHYIWNQVNTLYQSFKDKK